MPKYDHVIVTLAPAKGKRGAILCRATRALRNGGVSQSIGEAFREEAMSGDDDHLLQTIGEWMTIREEM